MSWLRRIVRRDPPDRPLMTQMRDLWPTVTTARRTQPPDPRKLQLRPKRLEDWYRLYGRRRA